MKLIEKDNKISKPKTFT